MQHKPVNGGADAGRVPSAVPAPPLTPGAGSSIRVALLAGFGIVVALWLVWGYQMMRALAEIERDVADVHRSYRDSEQTISRVRTNVLLGSIYLRDALIENSALRRGELRTAIAGVRGEVDRLLRQHVPRVTSSEEREHWALLQQELTTYWTSREMALAQVKTLSAAEAAALLRSRVVPSRESVLQMLDQLGALQDDNNRRHRTEADRALTETRTRLAWIGIGTLLLAAVVVVLASRHVHRLQRHIELQRLNEQRNRRDLERLSASLVDVQEQERRNLARELHDEVGQALTAVKMDIGVALRSDVEPRARAALEEANDIAETALRGVRDLSQLLHPSMLDDFGLPATLTAFLRSFSQRTHIRAQLAETLEERLLPELEVAVYRIVQEALNNVAQHSGASACTVSLVTGGDLLRLVIEDNGRGLGASPQGASDRRGLGLIGMRERAQAFGGSFAITSGEGGGTRVELVLPLLTLAPVEAPDVRKRAG
jgi:signal transduction histidine kinase